MKLCNDMGVFALDPTFSGGAGACNETSGLNPGAHPDMTFTLSERLGDLSFSSVVTMTPGSETIAVGGAMPAGERVGAVSSNVTLGTFNSGCNQLVSSPHILYNVALPDNTGDPRASTNITYPQPQGADDRFGRWGAPGAGTIAEGGGSAVIPGPSANDAASTTNAVQGYPGYLLDAFDPDFTPGIGDNADGGANSPPLVPLAVYGGLHHILGDWFPLYLVQFGPGGLTALQNSPLKFINANMGSPAVTVIDDPTATAASSSDVTDICSAFDTTTALLGVSADTGVNRVTNPGASAQQFFLQYDISQRDTDQDGYDNTLDACPLVPNTGDPRGTNMPSNGDADSDGIDDACDAINNPGVDDQDNDGFRNRQDNCVQVPNGVTATPFDSPVAGSDFQAESEISSGLPADKGPATDGIGNPCDSEAGTITVTQNGKSLSIPMSDSVANGRYMTVTNIVPKCVAGTDADHDGYCASSDPFERGPHAGFRHNAWQGPTHPALQMDTDGDGFSDTRETWYGNCSQLTVTPSPVGATSTPATTCPPANNGGADAVHSCAQTLGFGANANDEGPMDNWAIDLNDDGQINGSDLINIFQYVFSRTVDSGTVRTPDIGVQPIYKGDINNDGIVNGSDILLFAPVFGKNYTMMGIPPFSQQ